MTSTSAHANRQREIQILAHLNAGASSKDRRRKLLELYAVASDLSVPVLGHYLVSSDDGTRVASIHALAVLAPGRSCRVDGRLEAPNESRY